MSNTNLVATNNMNQETVSQEDLIKSKNQNWEKAQIAKLQNKINIGTPYNDIVSYMMNEHEQSKKMSNFDYAIECFKEDGVYQLHKAITKKLGVAKHKSDSNPSGEERPINTISVTLYDGTTYKVPYGKIELHDIGKDAFVDIYYDEDTHTLFVRGKCQFRFSSLMDEVIDLTRLYLNTDSIYKNLAIELDSSFKPRVMDLSNIHKEFMVLSSLTEEGLKPVKARILNAEGCKAKKVPLKYGVLLYGKYGTGKTLLAFKLAAEAIQNNWCFIYLKDPTLLAQTLRLSKTLDKNGNGVIIFVEDIDQVTSGDRDAAMQDILNTLDGGDTKNMNVISMFTTNHIEKINPTLLRGKRIGSMIEIGHLDAETAMKYIHVCFDAESGYSIDSEGLEDVCREIEENEIVPAFMAEICEKVKTNMIFDDTNTVTALAIKSSLTQYLGHIKLSKLQDTSETKEQVLYKSFSKLISETVEDKVEEVINDNHKIDQIYNYCD